VNPTVLQDALEHTEWEHGSKVHFMVLQMCSNVHDQALLDLIVIKACLLMKLYLACVQFHFGIIEVGEQWATIMERQKYSPSLCALYALFACLKGYNPIYEEDSTKR